MDKRFRNSRPNSLKDFTMLEARGWVIEQLNEIEIKMDIIITNHFQPKDERDFKRIMLNSTIISFYNKVKILRGVEIITDKDYTSITEMSRIRNGFAHQSTSESLTIQISRKENEGAKLIEATDKMDVMNSRGVIDGKDVRDWINIFHSINERVSLKLNGLIKSL